MKLLFMIKCFALGMSAASGVGPLFVLTFNRGALKGFIKGFATALGSALGDALLFFFGLIGLLGLLQGSRNIVIVLDLIGGIALVILGTKMINSTPAYIKERVVNPEPFYKTMTKSFILTVINPLAVLFFLIVSVQVLPAGQKNLPFHQVVTASLLVGSGSLVALTLVAFAASKMGKTLSSTYLSKISYATGILFIAVGIYFFSDVVIPFLNFFKA